MFTRQVLVLASVLSLVGPSALHCSLSIAAEATVLPNASPGTAVLKVSETELKELAQGNNRFALALYAKIKDKQDEEGRNLFLSPFSIRTALCMAYAGARGETAAQMKRALALTLDDSKLHQAFNDSIRALNESGQGQYEFAVANSLWAEKTYPFGESFLETNRAHYGAGVEFVDFLTASEEARQAINRWVEEKTQRRIAELIPPRGVTPATRLVLANAVYFKGRWAAPFVKKETQMAPFDVLPYRLDRVRPISNDRLVRVPLMHRTDRFGYASLRLVERPTSQHPMIDASPEAGMVQVLELPYMGGHLSMIVLLPNRHTLLRDLESELSFEKLETACARLEERKVEVFLPRFRVTWGTEDLGPNKLAVLPDLGMPDAFDCKKADFSGMHGKPATSSGLFISEVFHKAFADVNEEGSEAAASTAVVMSFSGMPGPVPVFRADHPFLFMICEKRTGAILFMGRMLYPTTRVQNR